MSQRPRNAYAAGIQRGLPGWQVNTRLEVLAATVNSERRRPAQIRQVRAGVNVEGRNNAGSSRTPFRYARQVRPIWQY